MMALVDTQNVSTMTQMNTPPPRRPPLPPLPPDLPTLAPAHAEITPDGAAGSPAVRQIAPPIAPVSAPTSAPATPVGGPLTAEHLAALTLANQRSKKLRSAAGVAMFNGICIGAVSGLSLLFAAGAAMFGEFDWVAAVMGIGLGAIAWNEFRGRKMLQQFNPRGPAVLGWNQLALLGLIVAYAAWMMGTALLKANPYDEAMQREPMMKDMLGDFGHWFRMLTVAVYGGAIVGSLLFQGLNSLYYFTRGRILRGYLADTPAWVVQLQRCQAASG